MAYHALLTTNVDTEKAMCAVAYVVSIANEMGKKPTQYDVVKAIFFADKAHMNKYGRPVTYDNYSAMKHGPVPRFIYDAIKNEDSFLEKNGLVPLWGRSERDVSGKWFFDSAIADSCEDVLSESDQELLRYGIQTVLNLGFGQVRRLTHDDPAYIDAWDPEAEAKSFPMKLELLFEREDKEAAENIVMLSSFGR